MKLLCYGVFSRLLYFAFSSPLVLKKQFLHPPLCINGGKLGCKPYLISIFSQSSRVYPSSCNGYSYDTFLHFIKLPVLSLPGSSSALNPINSLHSPCAAKNSSIGSILNFEVHHLVLYLTRMDLWKMNYLKLNFRTKEKSFIL